MANDDSLHDVMRNPDFTPSFWGWNKKEHYFEKQKNDPTLTRGVTLRAVPYS